MLRMLKLSMGPNAFGWIHGRKINWEQLNSTKDSSSDSGNPWTTGTVGHDGKKVHGLICIHLARLHPFSFPKQGSFVHNHQLGMVSGLAVSQTVPQHYLEELARARPEPGRVLKVKWCESSGAASEPALQFSSLRWYWYSWGAHRQLLMGFGKDNWKKASS